MHSDPDLKIPIGLLNDLYDTRTRPELLAVYAKWSRHIVGDQHCNIALQCDGNHLLVTTITQGTISTHSERYRISDSLLGVVFSRQEAMQITDLDTNPYPGCRALAADGVHSLMIAPIVIRGRCYGIMAVSLRKTDEVLDLNFALLQAVGRCLAGQLMVIERMENLTNALITDSLTKVGNRRRYSSVIDQLWGAWQSEMIPFSIMLIDIDNFKSINDRFGHGIGDQVLCGFANRLRANVRKGDKIMRIGGEEFAITFGGDCLCDGLAVAKRLHHMVRSTPFSAGDGELRVTACFGLSEVTAMDSSHNDVFGRADKALYRAKEKGRDKIVVTAPAATPLAVAS